MRDEKKIGIFLLITGAIFLLGFTIPSIIQNDGDIFNTKIDITFVFIGLFIIFIAIAFMARTNITKGIAIMLIFFMTLILLVLGGILNSLKGIMVFIFLASLPVIAIIFLIRHINKVSMNEFIKEIKDEINEAKIIEEKEKYEAKEEKERLRNNKRYQIKKYLRLTGIALFITFPIYYFFMQENLIKSSNTNLILGITTFICTLSGFILFIISFLLNE